MKTILVLLLTFFGIECSGIKEKEAIPVIKEEVRLPIFLQPFESFSKAEAEDLAGYLTKMGLSVQVAAPIPLPRSAWYQPKKRYRADSLIRYLSARTPKGSVTIGLTHKDISTTKDAAHKDFGVMGLGFQPGKACIVSSFRIRGENKKEKMLKVMVHEFGHNTGLPHCPQSDCLMRDAKGKDHLNEEKAFCKKCKSFLSEKNVHINTSF